MLVKQFVLDTNVLLADPGSLWQFGEHDVIIAITVLEELDRFKQELSVRGVNARTVLRYLDALAGGGDLQAGIPLAEFYPAATVDRPAHAVPMAASGRIKILLDPQTLPGGLADTADHRILALALTLQAAPRGESEPDVVLVSNDVNLRIKARVNGVMSEEYHGSKSGSDDGYDAAMKVLTLDERQFKQWQDHQQLPGDAALYPNEFVVLARADTPPSAAAELKPCDPLSFQHGVARARGSWLSAVVGGGKTVWGIAARNLEQYCAVHALLDDDIRLVTLTGKAGSGKTLLAMACGLHKTTEEDAYQKLLCSRPIFPMGKDIGYLPGDINDKINPWMQPIFDSLEYLVSGGGRSGLAMLASVRELFDQNMVAVEPLTYFRGRSLTHHYFVVDEAQNLSSHEVKAIVTRAGQGTKVVLTGDPEQIDVPYLDRNNNGLVYAAEKLRPLALSAHIHLHKGERSDLAELAAELL